MTLFGRPWTCGSIFASEQPRTVQSYASVQPPDSIGASHAAIELYQVKEQSDLVKLGMLRKDEFKKFQQAENFLLAVRCHLHIFTQRPTDQLSFDLQVESSERMGYTDTKARRAVELFMQDYFTHATRVGDITRIFLTARNRKCHRRLSGSLLEPYCGGQAAVIFRMVEFSGAVSR